MNLKCAGLTSLVIAGCSGRTLAQAGESDDTPTHLAGAPRDILGAGGNDAADPREMSSPGGTGGDSSDSEPPSAGMGGDSNGLDLTELWRGLTKLSDETVWFENSTAIEANVHGGLLGGLYRLRLDRDDMTQEQLRLLNDLRVVEPNGGCVSDGIDVRVLVNSSAGQASYHANPVNVTCQSDKPHIGFVELEAFLELAGCLRPGDSSEELTHAPTVVPGSGCSHGFRSVDPQWFLLEVDQPGDVEFGVEQCLDRAISIEIFDEGGQTKIVELSQDGLVDAGQQPQCPTFRHRFVDAGRYAVRVDLLDDTPRTEFYLYLDAL